MKLLLILKHKDKVLVRSHKHNCLLRMFERSKDIKLKFPTQSILKIMASNPGGTVKILHVKSREKYGFKS